MGCPTYPTIWYVSQFFTCTFVNLSRDLTRGRCLWLMHRRRSGKIPRPEKLLSSITAQETLILEAPVLFQVRADQLSLARRGEPSGHPNQRPRKTIVIKIIPVEITHLIGFERPCRCASYPHVWDYVTETIERPTTPLCLKSQRYLPSPYR